MDVYEAIAHSENDDLSYIAEQRVYELQKAGKRSLTGHVFVASDFHATERISRMVGPNTDDEYRMLRKAADDYRAYRIDYELARLRQGRHPDTDPHFYDDFQTREFPHFGFELGGYLFWFFLEGPGCLAIPILLAAFIVRSVWRRKRGK